MNNDLERQTSQPEQLPVNNLETEKSLSKLKAETLANVDNNASSVLVEGSDLAANIDDLSLEEKDDLSVIQTEIQNLQKQTREDVDNLAPEQIEQSESFLEFDNQRQPNESNEDYIARLSASVEAANLKKSELRKQTEDEASSPRFNLKKRQSFNYIQLVNIFNDAEIKPLAEKIIMEMIDSSNPEVLAEQENENVFEKLKSRINFSTRDSSESDDYFQSKDYYNETNQTRSFFMENRKGGSKDNIPYAMSLFGVCLKDFPAAKDYFAKQLNDKRICLLGGGESAQDLVESQEVRPSKIVNIDPYLESENIDRGLNNKYQSLPIKADDPALLEKLGNEGNDKFDEVWASYSVPFYNKTPEEIKNLFGNIQNLLAENGNCRITPLTAQNQECIDAMLGELAQIKDSKKFNLHLMHDTLIIHKLETPASEVQDKKESENNQEKETPENFKNAASILLRSLKSLEDTAEQGYVFSGESLVEKTSRGQEINVDYLSWMADEGFATDLKRRLVLIATDLADGRLVGLRLSDIKKDGFYVNENGEYVNQEKVTGEILTRDRGEGIAPALDSAFLKVITQLANYYKQEYPGNNQLNWVVENANLKRLEEKKAAGLSEPELKKLEEEQARWQSVYGENGKFDFKKTDKNTYLRTINPDIKEGESYEMTSVDMEKYKKIEKTLEECLK